MFCRADEGWFNINQISSYREVGSGIEVALMNGAVFNTDYGDLARAREGFQCVVPAEAGTYLLVFEETDYSIAPDRIPLLMWGVDHMDRLIPVSVLGREGGNSPVVQLPSGQIVQVEGSIYANLDDYLQAIRSQLNALGRPWQQDT